MQNYFTQNSFSQKISKFSVSLILAAIMGVLVGCTGGSDTPTGVSPGTTPVTPTVTAATIQLLVSSPQMPSAGTSAVDLTAIVLSATRQVVSGRTVTFSTGTDATAFVNNISASGVSDANGLVTAKLNLGANKTNRAIALTASADAATATNSVDVTGTAITISGNSSLAFGAATTLAFSVKDSAGITLPNITVSVTSQTGNTVVLTPGTGTTNSSGQITALVTATNAGNDTITATAAGASATQPLTISSASFAFTQPSLVAPATSIDIPLNVLPPVSVSVNWKNAGVPQVGKLVTFAVSRGTVVGSPSTTDVNGDTPGVTISSSSAGTAIVTASGPGGTPAATLTVAFVATTASSVAVQAVPGTVQVTTGSTSQTSNTSTISVLVRDAANNLVKNAGVDFTIVADPSGGALNSARAVTDVNGAASVTYTAGTTSSPSNGVLIKATVTDINGVVIAAVPNTTSLTVAGQSLLVRLGTDNLVGGTAPVDTKTYAAVVTDAAGNAVVGTTVRFALRPGRYSKGYYTFDKVAGFWVQTVTVICPNEDLNFNGIRDLPPAVVAGIPVLVDEDLNFNGSLDPGNVATVTATASTDTSGVALAVITYPKDHASWVEQILEARTGVTGNDPPALVTLILPGQAPDYASANASPPGRISPYGVGDPLLGDNVCNNTK